MVSFTPSFRTFPEVISFISDLDNKFSLFKMLPGNSEETEEEKKEQLRH